MVKILPFKATIREVAGSYVVTIPKAYVDNSLVREGIEHQFNIEVP